MRCKNSGCVFWNKDDCTQDMTGITCFGYMKPKTNADIIRAMNDKELATWISTFPGGAKAVQVYEWLTEGVEDADSF